MTQTKKFSQFEGPSNIQSGDIVVGLRTVDGAPVNYQFTGVGSGGGGDSIVHTIMEDGSSLQLGDWVRIDAMGDYVAALATTAENAEVLGMVVLINGTTSFDVQELGYVASTTGAVSGLSEGVVYFLSASAAGEMTPTPPTTNGYVRKALFVAETATSGWIVQYIGIIIGEPGPIPSGGGGGDTSTQVITDPGNTFNVGDWLYLVGNNVWALTNASTLAGSQAIGVVTVNGDPNFTIQQSGFTTATVTAAYDSAGVLIPGNLVGGTLYYLSTNVPGQITPTEPTANGTASKPVFISQNGADQTGWIFPQRPILNSISSDNPSIVVITQANTFNVGDVVYIDANNHYALALADNVLTARAVGIVIAASLTEFTLQTNGYSDVFVAPFAPLTPATQYWLSDATPGGITATEPTTAGSYSKPMLMALNATTGYILEQRPIAVAGGGGGGSIIQVQSLVYADLGSFSSLGYPTFTAIPAFYSLAITPSSISSQILIEMQFTFIVNGASTSVVFRLTRDGVVVPGAICNVGSYRSTVSGGTFGRGVTFTYVDSPATTSPVTYGLTVAHTLGGAKSGLFNTINFASPTVVPTDISTIILQEIA